MEGSTIVSLADERKTTQKIFAGSCENVMEEFLRSGKFVHQGHPGLHAV
jgi:hypothetical protein